MERLRTQIEEKIRESQEAIQTICLKLAALQEDIQYHELKRNMYRKALDDMTRKPYDGIPQRLVTTSWLQPDTQSSNLFGVAHVNK